MHTYEMLQIAIASILINNLVFSQFLGLCPCFGMLQKPSDVLRLGLCVTVIMGFTSVPTWIINRAVLVPHDMLYLQTVVFILVIASSVLLLEMLLQKFSPVLYEAFGPYFPLIATNCAVLAVAILSSQPDPHTHRSFGAGEAFVNALSSGVGFTLALLLLSGLRYRLELSKAPRPLAGLPVIFLGAGLISLAFMGFAGLSFFPPAGR
jgi:electron transport complex protein RnfA